MKQNRKVVIVTGATSGIGRCVAERLRGKGYRVYGAARRPEAAGELGFKVVRLDVDSDDSVEGCVRGILEAEGSIDVLVNNAGFGIAGSVEETSIAEAMAQFETNYFGAVRMCRAVLPGMREKGSGLIVNMSSIGGLVSTPFQAHYCASKFALEGLSEGLRMEVKPFGIKVALVEPGDFKTGFTAGRKVAAGADKGGAYGRRFAVAFKKIEEAEENGPDPTRIAEAVERIIGTRSPRLRYVVAPAPQNLIAPLKRALPWEAIEKIVMANFGV